MSVLTFFILCLEGAVLSFNVAASAAVVPSIAKDFALSQFLAGKIIWFYMIPYGLAALIYGPLIRVIDAKRIELFCLFGFSLANLLASVAGNIGLLFAARFFMGLFGASVVPLGLILIARHIAAQERGKYVGIFFSATFVASLLGLFVSGILPWRWVYGIPAVLGFGLCLLIYFLLPDFKVESRTLRFHYWAAFKNRKIFCLFTYIIITSIFYHSVQQWLGVFFSKEFNFSQFNISMLITLTSFSGIFGEFAGGRLSDSFGRIKTVNLGIICMGLSALLLIFKLPLFILAFLMIIWGLGWTFNHAGLSTMLTDLPDEFLNEAASLNSSLRFLSGGIGVAVSGIIMQKSFSLGFGISALVLLLLLFFTRNLLGVK